MNGYVFYIGNLMFALDAEKIFTASLLSLLLTSIILWVMNVRKFLKSIPVMRAGSIEVRELMERCRRLFPIDHIEFQGTTVTRGMNVRVTLLNKKSFKGSFVGSNAQNMVCVITARSIIAQELKNIEKLELIEQPYNI